MTSYNPLKGCLPIYCGRYNFLMSLKELKELNEPSKSTVVGYEPDRVLLWCKENSRNRRGVSMI